MRGSIPAVLMVTGAYFPEASGAGLQCRALIRACASQVRFEVLTTAVSAGLRSDDCVDGVLIRRVPVSASSRLARLLALPRWTALALNAVRRADIVHLHGFSAKSRVVIAIARLLRRPVVIKLTSVGHDDAASMKQAGSGAWSSFRRADRFIGVSPRFAALHRDAGLSDTAFRLIPNGVDTKRFRPAEAGEQARLRREFGLPADLLIVLVVGFFSHEKRPDVAYDAWVDTLESQPASAIVFIGRTASPYYEIDPALARRIRDEAERRGCSGRVVMIEHTDDIERFYRAADVLVLPSTREGLPNVVLEAMASGLPCVVSRLPGVTDSLITDADDGLLVDPEDRAGFAARLARLLIDPGLRARLGAQARRTMEARFSLAKTAAAHIALYRELMASSG